MEREIRIKYHLRCDSRNDIPKKHIPALEDDAQEHIFDEIKRGYVQGELCESVRYGQDEVPEEDPEEGLSYSGWWKIEKIERIKQ